VTSRAFGPNAITGSLCNANKIRPKLFNATQIALETVIGVVKKRARFRAFSKQGWIEKQALSGGQSESRLSQEASYCARLCCGMNPHALDEALMASLTRSVGWVPDAPVLRITNDIHSYRYQGDSTSNHTVTFQSHQRGSPAYPTEKTFSFGHRNHHILMSSSTFKLVDSLKKCRPSLTIICHRTDHLLTIFVTDKRHLRTKSQ
jgi:hypothetical protein